MAWMQKEAIDICRKIEAICPQYGCHVALTGGTLYKDGGRKDCDILFYRIRQVPEIDMDGLVDGLDKIGVEFSKNFGWCVKFTCEGKNIDAFFPEQDGDEYPEAEENPIDAIGLEIL